MNKPAGSVFWQQRCTLHHGTDGLKSPGRGSGALQRWWHTTPPGCKMNLMTSCASRHPVDGAGLRMTSKVTASFLFFFLQLGVPFSSRDVVSVANRSLSRLGEIKTALVYVLHPDSAEDAENPSCTGAEGLMPGASCKALVPLNCPWAFPHCTFSQTDTDKPLDGNSSLLLLHRKHIQGFVNCCCSVLPK